MTCRVRRGGNSCFRVAGYQPLNGPNLISKSTLNVLEPGGRGGIAGVEEKRLYLCHEHISIAQEFVHLR